MVRAATALSERTGAALMLLLYAQSVVFVSKILYTVLYKFQFISVDGRVSYNSMHPNLLASYMLIGLSIAVYHMAVNIRRKSFAAHAAVFALTAFTLVMTSSRGGMLGVAAGIVAMFLVSDIRPSKKFGYLAALSAAALAALYFVFPIHFQRIAGLFSSENYMTMGARLHIWTYALKQFALNPLLGLGPAVCNFDIQQFSHSSMVDAHNFLLQKLCDVGIAGTLIYLAPLVLLARKIFRRGAAPEIKYPAAFLLAGLFTNSSFSPHYALPVLSMTLYALLAFFNSAAVRGAAARPVLENDATALTPWKSAFIDVAVVAALSLPFAVALKAALLFLEPDAYGEAFLWLVPVSFVAASFVYAFYLSGPLCRAAGNDTAETELPAPAAGHFEAGKRSNWTAAPALILTLAASLLLIYHGFYFYAAEKANGLGISYALGFSASRSRMYLDIAIKNDPTNIAYLLNKSFVVFIEEFFRGGRMENNPKIKDSLDLTKKTMDIFSIDQLLKSNLVLLSSKYEGTANFDNIAFKRVTPTSGSVEVEAAAVDTRIILQNVHSSFAKFSSVFGKEGYGRWKAACDKLKGEALAIINSEKIIKPGTKLTKYFDFIAITLKTATNMDLPNIGDFLVNGVNAAFAATDAADKFLPVKGFKEHSLQSVQQSEVLSTVAMILPVIWKYCEKQDSTAIEARFGKMLGGGGAALYPIIAHFLFGEGSAASSFANYDPRLRSFLSALSAFAEKDFERAYVLQRETMKAGGERAGMNAILLSWTCYKLGRTDEAREVVLYSQFNAITQFKRDFTYKRDLLFGGNIMNFYYLPLQAYYNEFIMLALIKMHGGDHSMVLKEIFDYLNTVVYPSGVRK